MVGSYLLYNELHYNSLMTDWGGYVKKWTELHSNCSANKNSFPKRRLCLRYYMNVCSRLLGKQSKKRVRVINRLEKRRTS